ERAYVCVSLRRQMVRLVCVLAERDDRLERDVLRPGAEHRPVELEGDVALPHALRELREDLVERPVGDALGLSDQVELLRLLHPAQTLDLLLRGSELEAVERP